MTRWSARRLHGGLGVIFAPLVLLWCVSGAVMLFVPFPDLSEVERRAALETLAPTDAEVNALLHADWGEALARSVTLQVERLGPRLVLRTQDGGVYDASTGSEIGPLSADLLDGVARSSVGHAVRSARSIEIDQWTVSGRLHRHRPLRRVEFDDPGGTHVYVSSRTGEIVQRTLARERRWNQIGAVAHWIYWTGVRRHAGTWSWLVIALSTLATIVLLIGLGLGLAPGRGRRRRPSAARRRHRLLGWTAGTFLVLWSASGLLSMNPFGLLASADQPWHAALPVGAPPSCAPAGDLRRTLGAALREPGARSARFIRVGSLGGTPAAWIDGAEPARRDSRAAPALLEPEAVRRALSACDVPPLLDFGPVEPNDPYLYGSHRSDPATPRLRARLGDPAATWIEFDGATGEVVRRLDRNGRLERWLHRGLHTLDVLGVLRHGPVGRPLVLLLLLASVVLVASGIGLRGPKFRAGTAERRHE